jgi:hypothetical protein
MITVFQINDVKGVKFSISDTCKNLGKENLGKDRYLRRNAVKIMKAQNLNMKIPPNILKIEE